MNTQNYAESLQQHNGYEKLFRPEKISFGLIAPMKGYPESPVPDMSDHEELITIADESGIGAIWLRDVPFFDPGFGDAGQLYDPMTYADWLIAKTKNLVIGTAGVVLPLRDPILVAKQALSLDALSQARFLLGIAGGDRPTEYPAFGIDYDLRNERYREAVEILKKVSSENYPSFQSKHYGNLVGNLDMIPKLASSSMPIINIGRAGQSLTWIAENTDGWFWHGPQARDVAGVMDMWNRRNEGNYNPYGYAHFFELSENPDEHVYLQGNFIYGGRNSLIRFWDGQRKQGLSHILLNLKPSRRNPKDVLEEFGKYIIPAFKD